MTRILERMVEPSLSCSFSRESYRFTSIPTWGRPVSVRITASDGAWKLQATILNGAGGYDPGQRSGTAQRRLAKAEANSILAAIAHSGFWTMPTRDWENYGVDGTQWIIEGRTSTEYHVVDRWCTKPGEFYDLGKLFGRLGGVPVGWTAQ